MSRDCPEPRKDNRSNRGGFNSTGGDRPSGFRSGANDGESKPTFAGWRGGAAGTTNNNNNSDDTGSRPTFGDSGTRGGFSNSTGGFRGNEGCFRIIRSSVI